MGKPGSEKANGGMNSEWGESAETREGTGPRLLCPLESRGSSSTPQSFTTSAMENSSWVCDPPSRSAQPHRAAGNPQEEAAQHRDFCRTCHPLGPTVKAQGAHTQSIPASTSAKDVELQAANPIAVGRQIIWM